MQYINTKDPNEQVSYRQATIKGLARGGGLYMPSEIPRLSVQWLQSISTLSDKEIGYHVMRQLIDYDSLSNNQLHKIIEETLSFPLPIRQLYDSVNVLELFHGPTMAFKDVGARFMSRCLAAFSDDREVNVLVATSGDTGSAVAHGFYGVEGVQVTILFPKDKVSSFQQYQMTSLGDNIRAIEVDGTFDDCQALVKQAFQDEILNKKLSLSSANSINVARLLPQSIYYFVAYKQMLLNGKVDNIVISVPSGNFGNITAGLIAKKMGLPIKRFIAANNANDAFYQYIKTGTWTPKKSVQTYSNAMDVGAPNNFDRILHLYNDSYQDIINSVKAFTFSDTETLDKMKSFYENNNYILDPHGAVGLLALEQDLQEGEHGIFLATAHPKKFESVVKRVITNFPSPDVNLSDCNKIAMSVDYDQFVNILTGEV